MLDQSPFPFRGVSCLRSARTGARSGAGHQSVALDIGGIAAAGYTVVSVPGLPPAAVEAAESSGLRFLLEPDDLNLSRVAGSSRHERLQLAREQKMAIRHSVRTWAGSPALLGVVVNRATVAHRRGRAGRLVGRAADELAGAIRSEHPGLLAAWRDRWPLDQECPPEFDCLLVDFELSDSDGLGPAMMAAHRWVGDRPLVLGNVALTGDGQRREADAQFVIDTALRCGAAGTLASRLPSPGAGEDRAAINRRTVNDLAVDWPAITVVVSAHNASRTPAE